MKNTLYLSPWFMLALMFTSQLIAAFGNLSVAPLAPFFQESYGITHVQIGFLTSVLSTGACLFAIPGGWLVDKLGIKNLLLFFGLLFAISYSLLGLLNNYLCTLILMLFIGISYGAMTPITTKSVVQWFVPNKRGFAMSIKQTGVVGGGAFSSIVIVYFGSKIGWEITVFLLGGVFLFFYLIIFFLYRDPSDQQAETLPNRTFFSRNLLVQLTNKVFLLLCLIMALFLWCQFSLTTYLLLFLKDTLLFSLFWSGTGLFVFLIGGIFGRLSWGWISDFYFLRKREYVIFINSLIGFVSFVILGLYSIYGYMIPNWVIILTLFFFGMNITGWNGVMITIVVEEVEMEYAGIASGISYAIGNLGTIIGVPISGFMIEKAGYFYTFWYLALILGFAAAVMVVVIITKQKRTYRMKEGKI